MVAATVVGIVRPHLARRVTRAALVLLVAGMWAAGLARAALGDATGVGIGEWLDAPAAITAAQSDDELYRAYIASLRDGRPYYASVQEALVYANQVRAGRVDTGSFTSFRQPALYVVLAATGSGAGIVWAALALASVAVLAAFALGHTFVADPVALAGPVAVAGWGAAVASSTLSIEAEAWAGMLVLASLSMAVWRARSPRAALWWHAGAALAATSAALVREIAAPLLLIGLAVALFDSGLRRHRIWIPWAAGCLAFALGYATHINAVEAFLVPVDGLAGGLTAWWHPDGSGVVGTVLLAAQAAVLPVALYAIVTAVGLAGPLVPRMDRARRALLVSVVTGGMVLSLLVRAPSFSATGGLVNTWGALLLPATLACVPLAFARLPRARRG